jgi:HD-like signal output (HDOD) protein
MSDRAKNSELAVSVVELPPFPAVAIRALQLASNNDIRLRELHEVICADQVFAGELLRLANSPLHGMRSSIKSTLQAAILLGYERLKGLVLTIGIRMYLAKVLQVAALKACWRHSLACAIVAEDLAVATFAAKSDTRVYLDKDVAYTAGMVHDLGRLALAVSRPKPYADFLKNTEKEPCNILAQERERFGEDHCQVGRSLTTSWNLPAEFTAIAAHHHDDMQGPPFDALATVHFSCLMADALGFQVAHSTDSQTYEELLCQLPERERQYFGPSRDDYALRIAGKIKAVESV